jgi:O-glycosyl hydrolase
LASSAQITIDGATTFQTIEGFGVNANHRSWGNDLKPVLDQLIDNAGMTMFRVIYDNTDWDTNNDMGQPDGLNWSFYNSVYSSPEFQKLWGLMGYLNQKGLTNGVMPNFQGFGPYWMSQGGSGFQSLAIGMEDEWAEMIASALIYARFTNHLQFAVVGPNNEPDLPGVGVGIADGTEYTLTLHKLAEQLDRYGLSDLRFVGPDLSPLGTNASTGTDWLPEMFSDPVVMAKVGRIGLHSYSDTGYGSRGVADFIAHSAYPNLNFWLTEFNVWCSTCVNGPGTNDWNYARGAMEYLLGHLGTGASACMLWEGYDGMYRNNWDDNFWWSTWGLFHADTNTVPITYTPRKTYYAYSQITKFVRPGARRIDLSGSTSALQLLAFYHPDTNQLTIAGVNSDSSSATISGTLASLPAISNLDLYYTTADVNLQHGVSVAVSNGTFSIDVPADSVFAIVGATAPAPTLPGAGVYHGLFEQPDRNHQHSGSFTLTLNKNGAYTGSLRRGANTFSLHGKFDSFGRATNTIIEARTNLWTVAMALDLAAGGKWLTGSISGDQWTADLAANRAAFNNRTNPATTFAGKYTAVLPGGTNQDGTAAQGDGVCALSITTAGLVTLTGSAADGTGLNLAVPLGLNGEWPVYLPVNGGRDSILGWVTNRPGAGPQGAASWIKTANANNKLFPAGLTNLTALTGWVYTPPTSTVLNFPTSLTATFEGADFATPLTNSLMLKLPGSFTDLTQINRLSLTWTRSTGLLSGGVTPSGTKRRATIRGVLSEDLGVAFGYCLSTNSSRFLLSP